MTPTHSASHHSDADYMGVAGLGGGGVSFPADGKHLNFKLSFVSSWLKPHPAAALFPPGLPARSPAHVFQPFTSDARSAGRVQNHSLHKHKR